MAAILSNESGARSRVSPHLDQVVSGVTGAERPFKEHVESVGFLPGFDQLVVLLRVQRNAALAVAPRVLTGKEKKKPKTKQEV